MIEAFASMIKPARTYRLSGGAPQSKDNNDVLNAIKQLEDTIASLKQSFQTDLMTYMNCVISRRSMGIIFIVIQYMMRI